MSFSPLSVLSSSPRSLEWLADPGALLSSTALSTGQLDSLGPILSLVGGAAESNSGDGGSSPLPDALTAPANQIVLGTHGQLELVGHEVEPLNGPLHGLTTLGEAVGLGHLGEGNNALTDLSLLAANPTETGTPALILNDAGGIAGAADGLAQSVTAVPEAGNGLVGTGSVLSPATDLLNNAVLTTHGALEVTSDRITPLSLPAHAVTGLGETVGLGHLGEGGNLLTDLSMAPGTALNGGGLAAASPVLTDLGHVLTGVDTLVGSLSGATDTGSLLAPDGLLGPTVSLVNAGILDIPSTLNDLGQGVPLLDDALHGLTALTGATGLGHLGEGGTLLTDGAALPGQLLDGHGLSALAPILGDTGGVVNAAGSLLGGVTGGGGTPLQPVTDTIAHLADGVPAILDQAGHGLPLPSDPMHSIGNLGSALGLGDLGQGGMLPTDVATLPGALLNGDAAGGALGTVTGALGGAANPVGSLLGGQTGDHGAGSHPLVDVAAGPATATPTADIAVLTPAADPSHAVQVSAVEAPADQPSLLHTALLTGDALTFPQTGAGADSLVGQLHDLVPTSAAAPADAGLSHDLGADLGLASLDLGGHAQATHPDPTPHGALMGTHLLGL